jgi:hypothetical protein
VCAKRQKFERVVRGRIPIEALEELGLPSDLAL